MLLLSHNFSRSKSQVTDLLKGIDRLDLIATLLWRVLKATRVKVVKTGIEVASKPVKGELLSPLWFKHEVEVVQIDGGPPLDREQEIVALLFFGFAKEWVIALIWNQAMVAAQSEGVDLVEVILFSTSVVVGVQPPFYIILLHKVVRKGFNDK